MRSIVNRRTRYIEQFHIYVIYEIQEAVSTMGNHEGCILKSGVVRIQVPDDLRLD